MRDSGSCDGGSNPPGAIQGRGIPLPDRDIREKYYGNIAVLSVSENTAI